VNYIRFSEFISHVASARESSRRAAQGTAMFLCSVTLMCMLGCDEERVQPSEAVKTGSADPVARQNLLPSDTVPTVAVANETSIITGPSAATQPISYAAAEQPPTQQRLFAAPLKGDTQTGAAPPTVSPSETIVAGDLLQVEVEGEEKYSGQVRVSALGAPFYNLGVIASVAGMGTGQLADDLSRRYRARDLRDPRVTISIREYAPRRVYLMGHVLRPGVITVNAGGTTTVMRAIAEAGGFTENANRQAISLLREGCPPQMLSESGILSDPSLDVLLKPDDQLIIPMIDRIYISGEVEHSGPLVPPSGEALTVSRALSMAGGLGRYASRRIMLLRASASIAIDLDEVLAGKTTDPVLQPGDTVFVPQRRF